MISMTVGEFKAKFSEVIDKVQQGEEIEVTFGKKKRIIGYFRPEIKIKFKRELAPLKHLSYKMTDDFNEITDEDFPIDTIVL